MKTNIIFIIICFALIMTNIFAIDRCTRIKDKYVDMEYNVSVLSDSITTYKGKNGDLVARISVLNGDMNLLKIANAELSTSLENMKLKNAELASQIHSYIENPIRDTIWKIDTTSASIKENFNFEDKWRTLSGTVSIVDDNMKMKIEKDIVRFNYTIAFEDNQLFLHSDNPYVKFESASGIYTKTSKPKRFNIGVQLGFGMGYGLLSNRFDVGPYIGFGVSYGFGF